MIARSFVFAVLSAAVGAAPALAQDLDPSPVTDSGAPRAAAYVRVAAGVAFPGSIDQDLAYSPFFTPASPLPAARSTDLSSGFDYAAAVGFQYPAGTRTELEYRRISADLDGLTHAGGLAPLSAPTQDDVRAQALMSNVYVSLAPDARINPYVGAGVGGAFVRNVDGERDADFAYQAKAGVEVALSKRIAFGVEGAYLRTLKLEFGPDAFEAGGPVGPRASGGVFKALSVMASVRATF